MLGNHNGRKPKLTCRSDFPSTLGGFPHSEIHGSKGIRTSPWLIAAYHVLHRLCMPRHPPIALKTLDRSHCQCPPGLLPTSSARKTSFSRSVRWPAVKPPIICRRLSVSGDGPPHSGRNPNKSSLHDVDRTGGGAFALVRELSFKRMTGKIHSTGMVEPDGIEPTTPCLQSRCSPS
jgi:hypothetical protein